MPSPQWRRRVVLPTRCCICSAIAREVGVELTIDDFDSISSRTPLIADLKPGGRFVANDLYKAGGLQTVAKRLLDGGLIHGDALTVSGGTLAEAAQITQETAGQEVVRPLSNPLKPTGGLVILEGNLAPEGCVVKVAGHERRSTKDPPVSSTARKTPFRRCKKDKSN